MGAEPGRLLVSTEPPKPVCPPTGAGGGTRSVNIHLVKTMTAAG